MLLFSGFKGKRLIHMENKEWVMPTHIIAGAGIVLNEKDEVLMVRIMLGGYFPADKWRLERM